MIAEQVLTETTLRFRKIEFRYEMVEGGRWGPRWLHRLIHRAAMNCGMIRHAIGREEVVRRLALSPEKLAALHPVILDYMDRDVSDLVIYCGRSTWDEIASRHHFRSHYEYKYGRMEGDRLYPREHPKGPQAVHYILNIPTFITPDMDGMIVVPHPRTWGA